MENTNQKQAVSEKSYPGELNFFHPNANGTGSAARFELKPARGRRTGCFFLVMARQLSKTARRTDGTRQMATFDWQNKLTVKLDLNDISEMLMVLHNRQDSINGSRGLFHDSANATTVIQLRKGGEFPGYALELSRKAKSASAEPIRIRIVLSESEALLLRLVFEQSLLLLVYGAVIFNVNNEVSLC